MATKEPPFGVFSTWSVSRGTKWSVFPWVMKIWRLMKENGPLSVFGS